MSRTDKDMPVVVTHRDRIKGYAINGNPLFDLNRGDAISGDSGFRKTRKFWKRARNKNIRRYSPESNDNGARPPYSGLKRTWDFE